MRSARVLVVGDGASVVDLLCTALSSVGYQVRATGSGADAVVLAERWTPHLMVQDGFEISRLVRGRRQPTPAVFLTPGDQIHRELPGLTIGGGEYLVKPFSPEELVSRVRSILRRTGNLSAGRQETRLLRFADLEMDEEAYSVRRAGEPIDLTVTEFQLLRYFLRNADAVFTRSQIVDHVWDYGYAGNEQVVDKYISRLRRKIDQLGPPLIRTVRGIGYGLRLPNPRGRR